MVTPYYEQDGITIYHRDCREVPVAADVAVFDPPYGIDFKSGMGGRHGGCEIASDVDTTARDSFLESWRGSALVFGSWRAPKPPSTVAVLTWEKGEHVGMGNLALPWKPNTEEIYVIGKGFHGRRRGSVLRHLAVAGCVGRVTSRHHPTEKPEPLMVELLQACPAGTILDPFMGSGTTLVAAKRLGRKAVGIEIEEKYCEIAVERLRQGALFGEAG